MSNGEVCCILGVCCPPAAQREKVKASLLSEMDITEADAERVAEWFVAHVSLEKMLNSIQKHCVKHQA